MSRVQGLLVGLAVGTAAVAAYRRRASLLALAAPRGNAVLPPAGRELALSGGVAMQNMLISTAAGTARVLSSAVQLGPSGIAEQARRYVQSARVQLDAAIAEGQATAAQTRRDLEARLAAAKADPASAKSAFN